MRPDNDFIFIPVCFSLLSITTFLVLFFQDYTYNVLTPQDRNDLWYSSDSTSLHYSFYFVLIGAIMYLLNIFVVGLSGTECHRIRYGANINEKSMEGVMMYQQVDCRRNGVVVQLPDLQGIKDCSGVHHMFCRNGLFLRYIELPCDIKMDI